MKAPIPDITHDLFDLSGYCSIVTGASAGTGLAIAAAAQPTGRQKLSPPEIVPGTFLPPF